MNVLKEFTKAPGARLDYGIEWKESLAPGEKITQSTWALSPATGLTILGTYLAKAQAVAWVEGGLDGEVYIATNRITTDLTDPTTGKPRVDERSIRIFVRAR